MEIKKAKLSNTKKILIVTTSFPSDENDTAGIAIKQLACAMKNIGMHVEVLCPSIGSKDEKGIISGIKVHRFRYFFRKYEMLFGRGGGIMPMLKKHPILYLVLPFAIISFIIAILKTSSRFDVMQIEWSVNGLFALPARFLSGKKMVVSLLGSDMMKARSSPLFRLINSIVFKSSDAVTAVSRALREEALEQGSEKEKTFYLPYGLSTEFLGKRPASFEKPFKLLYVGNLIKLKNVDIILKTMKLLPSYYTLTIVGDGPDKAYLENLSAELGINTRVKFTGRLPHDQIPEIMSEHHALILISLSEGKPNVVYEAMACGLSVVVSNIPGSREYITDKVNGLVIEQINEKQLKNALLTLFSSKELYTEISDNAKRFARKNKITWEDTARMYNNIYANLL